jgi:hypothetical protein
LLSPTAAGAAGRIDPKIDPFFFSDQEGSYTCNFLHGIVLYQPRIMFQSIYVNNARTVGRQTMSVWSRSVEFDRFPHSRLLFMIHFLDPAWEECLCDEPVLGDGAVQIRKKTSDLDQNFQR